MNKLKTLSAACLSFSLLAASSLVAANELGGNTLTPLGAEKAGNAAGTIPAWTGSLENIALVTNIRKVKTS